MTAELRARCWRCAPRFIRVMPDSNGFLRFQGCTQ